MTDFPTEDEPVGKPGVDADAAELAEPERVLLQMPVDIRNLSLVVLAGLGSLFMLHWAQAVFIPLMLSVLFSYALSPVVNWCEHRHIPRWLSAALLLLSLVGAIGATGYSLRDQAASLVQSLPEAAQKFRETMKTQRGRSPSAIETVQKAASQIEQAAKETSATPAPGKGAVRVVVEAPQFNVRDYLWSGTLGLVALAGQTTVIVFLTYYLMISGDTFRRKLIKLAGPGFSSKKITLQALHEVTDQIRIYLQVQLLTSVVVGVLTWLVLLAIGLDNAAVWGALAGVLNLVPYLGSIAMAAAIALLGFLQFESLNMALLAGGSSLLIHMVIGNLFTPWLTSRTTLLSPVAVFVGLLAWGWLWGIWGLLLGVPILMMIKAVCDRVDDLKPIGEFLGT